MVVMVVMILKIGWIGTKHDDGCMVITTILMAV